MTYVPDMATIGVCVAIPVITVFYITIHRINRATAQKSSNDTSQKEST